MSAQHPCPQCTQTMRATAVRTHYDYPFEVEQCAGCGGIWLDPFECNRMSDADVARIDPIDTNLLSKSTPIPDTLYCPKDKTLLTRFSDQNFPRDILIESCPLCGGFWFNKGELSAHRKHILTKNPRTTSTSRTAKLVEAFLRMNAQNARIEQERILAKEISKETLISIASFLISQPSNIAQSTLLYIWPILSILKTLMDTSIDNRVHIDIATLRQLIQEANPSTTLTQ